MPATLSEFDKKCFNLAINAARETYKNGNFPVGAVLVVGNEIIGTAGNERTQKKTWVAHAENALIITYGESILEAHKQKKVVKIYSTLEPCLQCLGASVANRINEIWFIEKDPIRGACDLKREGIGPWYKEHWPEIHHEPVSDESRHLLIRYFEERLKNDPDIWVKRCHDFYCET